jgi:uracil-DNA glycosylase
MFVNVIAIFPCAILRHMEVRIEKSWKVALREEFQKTYFQKLAEFVHHEYQFARIYPPPTHIFHAFDACPLAQVRVIILGQDPYHGPRQAHGLCFSVPQEIPVPPSLANIYREINTDLGFPIPTSGDLTRLAKQGVFLLNTTLTVRAGSPLSHAGQGWEEFTSAVIGVLNKQRENLVFLLWGRHAKEKGKNIDVSRHLVLTAPHPSPLSAYAGFFGCKHFSKTNEYLKKHGSMPIEW